MICKILGGGISLHKSPKKSKKRILLGLNYGTFLCKLTFCFALFLTVGQL